MSQEFALGQVVISRSGRDKGRNFIVIKIEGKFIYVVDGDLRRIENPKKKNIIHLKPTNTIIQEIAIRLQNDESIRNLDFRKALAAVVEVESSGK